MGVGSQIQTLATLLLGKIPVTYCTRWIRRQNYLIFPSNISLFHFGAKTHASHNFPLQFEPLNPEWKQFYFSNMTVQWRPWSARLSFGCTLKNTFCYNYKNEKDIETAVQIWLDEAKKTYTTLELMTYLIYDKIIIYMS